DRLTAVENEVTDNRVGALKAHRLAAVLVGDVAEATAVRAFHDACRSWYRCSASMLNVLDLHQVHGTACSRSCGGVTVRPPRHEAPSISSTTAPAGRRTSSPLRPTRAGTGRRAPRTLRRSRSTRSAAGSTSRVG